MCTRAWGPAVMPVGGVTVALRAILQALDPSAAALDAESEFDPAETAQYIAGRIGDTLRQHDSELQQLRSLNASLQSTNVSLSKQLDEAKIAAASAERVLKKLQNTRDVAREQESKGGHGDEDGQDDGARRVTLRRLVFRLVQNRPKEFEFCSKTLRNWY